MFTIRIKDGHKTRNDLSNHLAEKGIMTKVYFSPIHLTHYYKNILNYTCSLPVTENLAQQVLTLPMYPDLTEIEIEYIVQEISAFFY